ncbi:hypothetical protein VB773_22140 [Haloarculaceae archaeon H-GB2-1]|nr:hypothetical protein [Haloarculaceae archaeon H-GB1-1]MEA5389543.1 hypothetical protein [Haloarculaceae archaeon H-GB11]MEA5410002.1 hypothetical protein [Haloarculaceae archaeon H-GB2-1]
MNTQNHTQQVRETYTTYDDGGVTVAVIQDPENNRAWIQSTESYPIRP